MVIQLSAPQWNRRRLLAGALVASVPGIFLPRVCRAEHEADDRLNVSTAGWKTDFSKHSVPLSEFQSGGPPRDGIPPIDAPRYVSQAEADA